MKSFFEKSRIRNLANGIDFSLWEHMDIVYRNILNQVLTALGKNVQPELFLFYHYESRSKLKEGFKYSHEAKAPKWANSIQNVVEKNIHPWMSWRASSVLGSWNQRSPAMIPSPMVWTQFSVDSMRGRASWKFLWLKTWNQVEETGMNK